MAGMAVALECKLAVAPARIQNGTVPKSSSGRRSSMVKANGGLGGISLRRLQSKRVATELRRPVTVVAAKAEGQAEATDVQELLEETLKKAQEAWEKVDDKLAIGGLGVAALIVLWGSTGLISAIDKLPLIPQLFELVGLLFTGWFIYRYVLFKPDREELLKLVDDTKSKITGQDL